MMLSMVEVSPRRRYQVRQVSQPVGLVTGSHWCDSPSPPARRPPRDNPRPLSTVCDVRVASPQLLEDPPVPLELTRKLSNSAPELVIADEAERLAAMYQGGREGKRANRHTHVIGVGDDEEELGEEGVYSKLSHYKIAGVASERRKLEELRCSPESQYSSLNVIQDRRSESPSPINDYSYIDIDIIRDKTDGTSPLQSSQDMRGHNYFVLEIPEDRDEEASIEKEVVRKTVERGRIQPKSTCGASSIVKTTKAGNQINSYAEVNLCKIKPSAKHQKKLQQPIRSQVSEYELPIRGLDTPQRPRGYKPTPLQTRLADRAGSPQVLDDNIYSQVYLPREEKAPQQRRPFSPLPPPPTSSHVRPFQMSPRTSPSRMLPSPPRLSPSPPLISPKLASHRSSPLSPVSKRSPFSPSHRMSPTPSFSYVSSPKTPSPQNSSPSRSRHYSSSSVSKRDCTVTSSTHFKRGGCYSSQKLRGERIYCNNSDHRTMGEDSTHSNHVNIIITENGPVLLSNKPSPNSMAGGNGGSKTAGSSVDSLALEEGHYEFDPNFVKNVVQRS